MHCNSPEHATNVKQSTSPLSRFFPFLLWWPFVNRSTLKDDLIAGITGALIVLPQGVAFATIAGMPPEYGLYAAMVPAVVAALFGSSWHLVSGPTTAISIAVFAALANVAEPGSAQYIQFVLTTTFLVGIFQLALGLARMGALVNFISHTVVIGFTSGAAILIAASQVRNFFGIDIPRGTPFYEIVRQLFVQFGHINPWVASVGAVTLFAGIFTKRYAKKIPYMIAAMLTGSLFAALLNAWLGADHSGIRTVGALPAGLPPFSVPDFSIDALRNTLGPALVITMLALTEAVSIARAIAVRSEQRIDGNQEFIGQGLSNIVGSFFSSYASSGSFNRSGVNYEAGAKTPLASIFASIALVLILLAIAPLATYLPHAAMAGILFLVAWGLIDFHHIGHIWHTSKIESTILFATLIGTLFNLEAGIFLGVFLSLVTFLYRTSKPEIVPVVPAAEEGAYHFVRAEGRPECPQLRILRINGSIYFGSASYVQTTLQQIDEDNPQQKSVLIAAASLVRIDIAGAEMLAQEARRRRRIGGGLYFYRLNQTCHDFLQHGGYAQEIGVGGFFPVMTDVTGALYWTLDPDICRTCKTRIFKECNKGVLPNGFRRLRLMLAIGDNEANPTPGDIAIALARQFGVTLDLMTCAPVTSEDTLATRRIERLRQSAQASSVDTEAIIMRGERVVEQVVAAARKADTNILVVGQRPPHETGKENLPNKSVQEILVDAPCHVLIAHQECRLWQQRILMLSIRSPLGETMLDVTAQIARAAKLPVTVLAVASSEAEQLDAQEDAAKKASLLRYEDVDCDIRIVIGSPEQTVFAVANEIGADLIVIGNDQQKGLSRKLTGQTTDRIVGRAGCAVLVIKRPPEPKSLVAAVRNQVRA